MSIPMPDPCPEWANLLNATHPDDLLPSQQTALDAHLATCAACAAARADYARLDAYIQRLPTSRPLPAFPPKLLAQNVAQRSGPRNSSLSNQQNASHLVPQQKAAPALSPARVRGVAAFVTLAVIVVLFVVAFRGFTIGRSVSGQRPLSGSTPTSTATSNTTAPPPPGQWTSLPGLTAESGLPVIAPSNPSVVYEDLATERAPAKITLRRSDDDGATWHNLPLPIQVPAAVDNSSLAVSPLDASIVFLTISAPQSDAPQLCQTAQPAISGQSTLSGSVHCSRQYYSTDSGQHWSLTGLPMQGAIGAATYPEFQSSHSLNFFHTQGQRLYSALGGANFNGVSLFSTSSIRIVSSVDGGKTWQLVDADLAASGQNICDYMPAQSGSTIFAITQVDQYCYYDTSSPAYLWRSDDAGAHWTQVSLLPYLAYNITLVEQGDGAQPLIYLRMPITAQYETVDTSSPPPALEVSVDGGKTWREAPTRGLPQSSDRNFGPLGVLSDGSVLKAFSAEDQTLMIYAWKNGETAWQQIVQHVTQYVAYVLLLPKAGNNALWLVSENGGAYSVQRYNFN
jgi:hypothetical protein